MSFMRVLELGAVADPGRSHGGHGPPKAQGAPQGPLGWGPAGAPCVLFELGPAGAPSLGKAQGA